MADIINKDDSNFLEDFEFNAQSDNDNLKLNYYTLKIGENDMILQPNLMNLVICILKKKL